MLGLIIGIMCFIVGLLIIRYSRECKIAYVTSIVFLLAALCWGCIGLEKMDNTFHEYEIVSKEELSDNTRITLRRTDNNAETYLIVSDQNANEYELNEHYTWSNKELRERGED